MRRTQRVTLKIVTIALQLKLYPSMDCDWFARETVGWIRAIFIHHPPNYLINCGPLLIHSHSLFTRYLSVLWTESRKFGRLGSKCCSVGQSCQIVPVNSKVCVQFHFPLFISRGRVSTVANVHISFMGGHCTYSVDIAATRGRPVGGRANCFATRIRK